MFILYVISPNGPAMYKESLTKSAQATYQGSDLRAEIEQSTSNLRAMYPGVALTGVAAYTIVVQRKIHFTSKSLSLIPNTTMSLDANQTTASIQFVWSF